MPGSMFSLAKSKACSTKTALQFPNPIKDLAISWLGSALARHDPPTAAQRVSLMTIEARMAAGNGSRRCYVVPRGADDEQGASVKKNSNNQSRVLLCAVAGLLAVSMLAGGAKPAAAQASDAQERCTADVMRHCSEFVPDADRIVGCLKAKRRQLNPSCLSALTTGKGSQGGKKRRAYRRG
jgi:hypothetical protein